MKIGDEIQCNICGVPFIKYALLRICKECRNNIQNLKRLKKSKEPKPVKPKLYRIKKSAHSVGMPEFSGRTWRELEDIWPRHVRVSSEAHKIISCISPAWHAMKQDLKKRGIKLRTDELWRLFWIQRCEEAKENVATETYPIGKPHQWNIKLYYLKQSPLMRKGLIEWLPASTVKLVRVTALGKDILKTFIHYIEQAHRDIKMMVAGQPEENAAKVQRYLSRFCFNWTELEDL